METCGGSKPCIFGWWKYVPVRFWVQSWQDRHMYFSQIWQARSQRKVKNAKVSDPNQIWENTWRDISKWKTALTVGMFIWCYGNSTRAVRVRILLDRECVSSIFCRQLLMFSIVWSLIGFSCVWSVSVISLMLAFVFCLFSFIQRFCGLYSNYVLYVIPKCSLAPRVLMCCAREEL